MKTIMLAGWMVAYAMLTGEIETSEGMAIFYKEINYQTQMTFHAYLPGQ